MAVVLLSIRYNSRANVWKNSHESRHSRLPRPSSSCHILTPLWMCRVEDSDIGDERSLLTGDFLKGWGGGGLCTCLVLSE